MPKTPLSHTLSASVAGRLQWVAEAGTTVTAGELVARLDTRELALVRAEQAARVERAGVNLRGMSEQADTEARHSNTVP